MSCDVNVAEPISTPIHRLSFCLQDISMLEVYLLFRIYDLLRPWSRGKTLSKLDLSQAYLQVQLDEASQKYITVSVNTHRALFQD